VQMMKDERLQEQEFNRAADRELTSAGLLVL
jgi:hypothetical protein